MGRFRCFYSLPRPELGLGSAARVAMDAQLGGWPNTLPHVPAEPAYRFTVARLAETHVVVRELDARTLDHVYQLMQADTWSDTEREAFEEQFASVGITHATMSPGDVVEDVDTGRYYECAIMGWRELEQGGSSGVEEGAAPTEKMTVLGTLPVWRIRLYSSDPDETHDLIVEVAAETAGRALDVVYRKVFGHPWFPYERLVQRKTGPKAFEVEDGHEVLREDIDA